MANIKSYQEAYEKVVSRLKSNSQVVAIVVCGSMVSGDIWDESDIDFQVITKEKNKAETIYSKVNDIPIHINYISKETFINSYKNILKGGTFHKTFFAGKLVYCSDDEINDIHLSARFYGDRDKNVRNVEILCNLLNSVHYAKKYLATSKVETSYQWCIEVLKNYSRLLISMNGHITDKDVLSFAVNISDEINQLFNVLQSDLKIKEKIQYILETANAFLDLNLETISMPVLQLLKEAKMPLSVQDIQNHKNFSQINGDLNLLLEKLTHMKLIREGSRRYTSYGDEFLIDEIVYYVE